MIPKELVKSTVIELLRFASNILPDDVKEALQTAYNHETEEVAKKQLKAILENVKLAKKNNTPMCQDTGVLIFYVTLGDVEVEDIEGAIQEGVKEATKIIPLRPNAVHPFTRENPGNNIGKYMPYINLKQSRDKFIEIIAMPKGGGAENMSRLVMLTPTQGLKGTKQFILETVLKAGSQPCPPGILGVGIGGSADIAMKLGKEALLRPINKRNSDLDIAKLEEELLEALNQTGIGPMGLGGKTTILAVNIEYAYCHTASLPVAINYQCWAARKAIARIYDNGKVDYISHRK